MSNNAVNQSDSNAALCAVGGLLPLPTAADNQRQAQAQFPHLLEACIQCGMCLSSCPTYQVTGSEAESPRGRIHLMDLWQQEQLTAMAIEPHINQCLGCRSCETACPSNVQYGELLNTSRYLLKQQLMPHWFAGIKRWLLAVVLPSAQWLQLARLGALLYQTTGLRWLVHQLGILKCLPASLQAMEALCPPVSWQDAPALMAGQCFGSATAPLVCLPVGCVMNTFMADIHYATIDILVALGYQVLIPALPCCGALAHHAGERSLAQQQAVATLTAWQQWQLPMVTPIVMNSAGCGAHYKELTQLFSPTDEIYPSAQAFSQQVVDIHEWLLPQLSLLQQRLKLFSSTQPTIKAIYQPACHLYHAQQIKTQPMAILEQLPNIEWVPLPDATLCCGSAGIYNIEQPVLSQQVLAAKLDAIEQTQATVLVVANPGCYLQLRKGLQQRGMILEILHPVQLIARCLGKP
jgi:glycolate oxidase iron-sulfur subunit